MSLPVEDENELTNSGKCAYVSVCFFFFGFLSLFFETERIIGGVSTEKESVVYLNNKSGGN